MRPPRATPAGQATTAPLLNQGLLSAGAVPAEVETPNYDRAALTAAIVHIGVGGFHRAHQAVYLDDLMNAGLAHNWAICGVGLLPTDRAMADVLHAQDGLYTVVVRQRTGETTARVIGSIVEYLFAPDDPEAVLERMSDPRIRIVSLTVTEGGYNIDPVTGEFDLSNRAVATDIRQDGPPRTMYALVVESLRRRRERDVPPFAVVSCDNVEHNGDIARRSIAGYAAAIDRELAQWITDSVRFPSSMVDRITPATTDADRMDFPQHYGFRDGWPVFCEPFMQWVVEDVLPATQRPPLEDAGVQLVDDVGPYEFMKLRLLNAGHQAVCYLGTLAGYEYVHEACADPAIAGFLRAYLAEVTPTLRPVPGIDLREYQNQLVVRFANPGIADRIERICAYSSDRMPKFVLPALADNARAGRGFGCAALVVAAWMLYVRREATSHGAATSLVDARADDLRSNALAADAVAFVADRSLFGDLTDDARFLAAYREAVTAIETSGPQAAAHAAALRSL